MKYTLKTFGCAMNIADSEKINMILRQAGLTPTMNTLESDVVIFNTCSVRQKGEDRVFGTIHEVKKQAEKAGKEIIVGVTGCMSRKTGLNEKFFEKKRPRKNSKKIEFLTDKEGIFNNDDKLLWRDKSIDFTVRIEEISHLTKILSVIFKKDIGNDEGFESYLKIKQDSENKTSANIIIQTGCDNYCTFCIVPYTRGSEISRDISEIISEASSQVKSGAKEILLLGQNVNSYGKTSKKSLWNEEELKWANSPLPKGEVATGFKTPFRELLEELDKIEGLDRIRFTSSNPHDMTPDILDAHFDLDKTCNYLHFALQSGNDEVLKKMNRKHSYKDFKIQVDYLRSKDPLFSISTDIIVGFPGETEEQFQDTVKAMIECEFDFAYIARYSSRTGTYATNKLVDDILPSEKARRWGILNEILYKNIKKRGEMMIGLEEEILINSYAKKGGLVGRTRNFKEVFIEEDENIKIGDLIKVRILELDGWVLKGEVIKK